MNFYNWQSQSIDATLAKSVFQILNAQHFVEPLYCDQRQSTSFIKIKERSKKSEEYAYYTKQTPFCRYDQDINKLNDLWSILNNYWYWDSKNDETIDLEESTNDIKLQNIDTYKELKEVARKSNPDITKEEIYEQLLKPYRHEKVRIWDKENNKFKILYICKYDGWNKEFNKTWNLLDHVRMHEGIKPHKCKIWGKTFTQKGNLKKHNIVQHSIQSLKERKKFKWVYWEWSYTERYNLKVNFDCFKFNLLYNLSKFINNFNFN